MNRSGPVIAQLGSDMKYLMKKLVGSIFRITSVAAIAVMLVAGSAYSQSDAFGYLDTVYVESVDAGPGQDIPVRFFLNNDETVSALSIPITYDPNLLILNSVSFGGSRIEYIATKTLSPSDVSTANGHFMVGVVVIMEDPLPPGDGLIFTALFTVSGAAEVGSTTSIDSLFYPPGGELILAESTTSGIIRPFFRAGTISFTGQNSPPVLASVPDQYVLEGDSLILDIEATDLNRDQLSLVCTAKPVGANFVDNGDGTGRLTWVPSFVGPNSSDGSPFAVNFWVSDGDLSGESQVAVHVINRNRPPVISDVDPMEIDAGQIAVIALEAIEPDFDPVTWSFIGPHSDDAALEVEPTQLVFNPDIRDEGQYEFNLVAVDPFGASDTTLVRVQVNAVAIYTLSLDTISAYPADEIEINIVLNNVLPVSSFNLLINFDPSVLNLQSLTNISTRSEGFESFSHELNPGNTIGNIRVLGQTAQGAALEAGEGSIVKAVFQIVGDIGLGGYQLPLQFVFVDGPSGDDNTLSDTVGVKIGHEQISYVNGYVNVLELGAPDIGDINLNGIAFEISDAIYFTNYFMDPVGYPFNPLQYANSDINQDNIAATLADLVALINTMIGGVPYSPKLEGADLEAVLQITNSIDGTMSIGYDAEFAIGAILVEFTSEEQIDSWQLSSELHEMTLDFSQDGSRVAVMLYSFDGNQMPSGSTEFLTIENSKGLRFESIEMASSDGESVAAMLSGDPNLPTGYTLRQNYPNPFNPETQISFDLPVGSSVRLTVFNVLGQEVRELINSEMQAGTHTVRWNGRDNNDQPVGSGIYFYRLQSSLGTESRKMMLMK